MGREEVELKLALAPGGVQALRRSALWSSLQGAAERRLTSTYYDTGKRDLLAQDYSLRVRRQGGRFIQTLKAGAGRRTPGLFRRGEWEGPLHDATPDPALIVDGKVPRRIRDLRPAQLQPVLSTRIHRRLRSLRDGPTMVELALDTGAVLGADGTQRQPICELELELKEGMPAGLFALAHEINQITPVRLQRRSKLQQGLAGDAPQPRWQKATPLRLSPEMPVAAALAAIFDNCLDHMVANEACAITGAHVEGVHQMRVAARRLRSALQLFADLLPEAPAQALEAELEWLADALGPARDLDVFADEVLEPARRAVPDPAVLDILLQRAERKRRRAYRLVAEALGSARYGALTLEILRWRSLEVWRQDRPADSLAALDEPLGRLAGRLLDRLQGRVLKRGKGFARLDAAGRHRVRIALKKLRYAVEFFGDLYSGSRCRGYLKRLKRLQDDLGRANDVATAASLLDAVAGRSPTAPLARAVGAISGWHRRGVAELEPKLLKDWRSFAAAAPFWR